jgi:hypothetical protein
VVSKGEETHDAALDERRSMGAARGEGALERLQCRSTEEKGGCTARSCPGEKGKKGWGWFDVVCARARGGATTHGDGGGGQLSGEQGKRAGGGGRSWYGGAWAASGESGPARGEGKWVGPRKTVSGGGGKLI